MNTSAPTIQKKTCALVRVSSEEQVRGGYGLEFQERDIREFCRRNDLDLIRVFRDEGFSGATEERPGFQEMMSWAREKRFEILVVWKLDRLFRNTKLTLQTVDELASLGVKFRSVQESFTHDSNGRFLLTIFAAGAEKERKDITTRMYAGRIASARRGTWINGGLPPYGYRYNRSAKRLEIDPEEASIVQQLYRWLVDERLSLYQIQSRINKMRIPTKFDRLGRAKTVNGTHWWARRTLGRILSNEVYSGEFTFRQYASLGCVRKQRNQRPEDEWIKIETPAIIAKELFLQAQGQLRMNSENSPRRTNTLYLLSKLLICGYDGRRMQAARRRRGVTHPECKYYFCSGRRKVHRATPCLARSVSESRIAPAVWAALTELLTEPQRVLREVAAYRESKTHTCELAQRKAQLAKERERVVARTERLVELYLSSAIDSSFFRPEQRRLKGSLELIDRDLARLDTVVSRKQDVNVTVGHIDTLYARYKDKLNAATDQLKREVFQTFVKSVVLKNDDLQIEVRLSSGSFEGQPSNGLSHKQPKPLPIILKTKLVPVGLARKA